MISIISDSAFLALEIGRLISSMGMQTRCSSLRRLRRWGAALRFGERR